MDFDQEIDALGLLCPLPVLKARKRLKGMVAGEVLKLVTDDPAAVIDVPHFCSEQGYNLQDVSVQENDARAYYIIVET